MKSIRDFIIATLLGGSLIVLPVAVVGTLVVRSVVALKNVIDPMIADLPHYAQHPLPFAVALFLGVCFVAGALLQTRIGSRAGGALEQSVFARLPGYLVLKNMSRSAIGQGDETFKAAFFKTDDGLLPAVIVEDHGDLLTIFVPGVPTPTAGALYFANREDVYPIDVPVTKIAHCVSRWGVGSTDLVKALRANQENA